MYPNMSTFACTPGGHHSSFGSNRCIPGGDWETQDGQFVGQFPALRPEGTDQPDCPQVGSEDQRTAQREDLGGLGSSRREEATHRATGDDATQATCSGSEDRPQSRCPACHGGLFWRDTEGAWKCAVCHPPGVPEIVAEWLQLEENGAKSPGDVLPKMEVGDG